MSNILSLSKARKAKERSDKEKQAEQNRLLHGRTKAEKKLEQARREKREAILDGARRDQDKP